MKTQPLITISLRGDLYEVPERRWREVVAEATKEGSVDWRQVTEWCEIVGIYRGREERG